MFHTNVRVALGRLLTMVRLSLSACFPIAIFHCDRKQSQTRSGGVFAAGRTGLLLTLLFMGVVQTLLANTNPIKKENLKLGTTDWQLTNPADNRQIEGYASLTSVPQHGFINLFVNTDDANYTLSVYRMGWYGGTGGRLVLGPKTLQGVHQFMPFGDPTKDILECQWVQPFTIQIPYNWLSGIYLVKLHGNTSGKESYITFTVRDSRRAKIVFQQAVATYQAYNPWPGIDPFSGQYVGQSLYPFETVNEAQVKAVSFNRPYTQYTGIGLPYPSFYGVGAGDFLYNVGPVAMEYSMVRWLEHEGYDVTYITDLDTHEDVGRLLRGKAFLSVGHDEYWSQEMKANAVAARDQGVSLGFFGGNYMYWPVEFYPDSNGLPDRTISLTPLANRCTVNQTQQCGSDADCSTGDTCQIKVCDYACFVDQNGINSQTEQAIVGGMDQPGVVLPNIVWSGDIFVSSDALINHWVFANTGLNYGDVIPGIIGIEYNSTVTTSDFWTIVPGTPIYPLPGGLQTLLHSQAPNFGNTPSGGGFPLPSTFDGKDFNSWYDSLEGFAAQNGGNFDLDPKFCRANPATACSVDSDCGVDGNGKPIDACIFPCHTDPIPPLNKVPPAGFCSNPFPYYPGEREDWAMTIYQASSGAWVFNGATNDWSWGLDDYFTGINNGDGVNNGPALRTQCGYPFFHPGLVSCRNPALQQITRNVLNKFIGH